MTNSSAFGEDLLSKLRPIIQGQGTRQLKGMFDIMDKDPVVLDRLARKADKDGPEAAKRATDTLYDTMINADIAAAMVRHGLRPDGSVEAKIAMMQCMVQLALELDKFAVEQRMHMAKVALEVARIQTATDMETETSRMQVDAAVIRQSTQNEALAVRQQLNRFVHDGQLSSAEADSVVIAAQSARRIANANEIRNQVLAFEEADFIRLEVYRTIQRKNAFEALRRAERRFFRTKTIPEWRV